MMMAASLAGCSSDDNEPQKLGATSRPMIVDVEETPISNGETPAPKSLISRGADPTTTATLSSFSMNYQENKYDFTKNGTWSTNAWPSGVGNDQKIDFYAYTRGTFNYNGGNPYVAFTIEEAAANQYDLLVAEHKNISYNDAGGHVSLLFAHASAAVRFSVQITNTLHTNLGGDLTVKSIVLRNVNSEGRYYYSSKEWTNQSNLRPYTLTSGAITVTTTPQQLSSNYLYMIPQTHAAEGETGIHLDITYNKGGDDKHAIVPLDIDWKAGELYPINIKLGTTLIQ